MPVQSVPDLFININDFFRLQATLYRYAVIFALDAKMEMTTDGNVHVSNKLAQFSLWPEVQLFLHHC